MSGTVRGRRNPTVDIPALSRLAWGPPVGRAIQEALKHQDDAFDSLPAPHASTHHFGESDELSEFGDEFLLLAADALLPNARVIVISGGLGSTDSGGLFTVIVADNGITNAKLRDSIARSVIGRAANSAGDPADIQATGVGQVLQQIAGNTLAFASVPSNDSVVTPATLTANVNDYAALTATVARVSSNASRNITGILAELAGSRKLVINVGANDVVLTHQDAASAAANRLLCPGAASVTLNPDEAALCIYDGISAVWRVFPL